MGGEPDPSGITRRREELVYSNAFVRVYDDEVEFPDGVVGRHVRILPGTDETPVVLVVLHEGRIALVETDRYAVGRRVKALPRGMGQDADPLVTAAAELGEEVGGRSADLRVVGHLLPDSGLLATRAAVVFGSLAEPPGQPSDRAEVLAVEWVTPAQLSDLIATGAIEDGITLAAWALVLAQGLLHT
jgi:hypothetical protein